MQLNPLALGVYVMVALAAYGLGASPQAIALIVASLIGVGLVATMAASK